MTRPTFGPFVIDDAKWSLTKQSKRAPRNNPLANSIEVCYIHFTLQRSATMKPTLVRGEWVEVEVDGEKFEGEVVWVSTDRRAQVKIPFYYSLSVKHGRPVKHNSKCVIVRLADLGF